MIVPINMSRHKSFRHPRGIIADAVRAYHGFALSTADVEDQLAARGVIGKNGDVLNILVQTRRNAKAAKPFFQMRIYIAWSS